MPLNVQEAIDDVLQRVEVYAKVGLGVPYASIALIVYPKDPERVHCVTNVGALRDELYPHSTHVARITWPPGTTHAIARESIERQVRQCLTLIAEQRAVKKRVHKGAR